MIQPLTKQIQEVVRLKRERSAKVIAEALETGMAKLYTDAVLCEFLRGRLSRKNAIKRVGLEAVRQAERQARAVREDVEWGLHG